MCNADTETYPHRLKAAVTAAKVTSTKHCLEESDAYAINGLKFFICTTSYRHFKKCVVSLT